MRQESKRRRFAAALTVILAVTGCGAIGCGVKAPPRPPLPEAVKEKSEAAPVKREAAPVKAKEKEKAGEKDLSAPAEEKGESGEKTGQP